MVDRQQRQMCRRVRRRGFLQYLTICGLIGVVLMVDWLVLVGGWTITADAARSAVAKAPAPEVTSNTHALGEIIYTQYIYLFQAAGLVLLVAMIGAIVLTHRHRDSVKKQNIGDQLARRAEEAVELQKVDIGKGI